MSGGREQPGDSAALESDGRERIADPQTPLGSQASEGLFDSRDLVANVIAGVAFVHEPIDWGVLGAWKRRNEFVYDIPGRVGADEAGPHLLQRIVDRPFEKPKSE